MLKPLLIGPAPGPRAPAGWPAFGPGPGSGRRLCQLLGLTAVRHYFDALNLLDYYPGRATSGGDKFDLEAARQAALKLDVTGRPFVLLAGNNVARAFGIRVAPLTWVKFDCGVPVAVLPHPSGMNRWWNDSTNCERARAFVRSTLSIGDQ